MFIVVYLENNVMDCNEVLLRLGTTVDENEIKEMLIDSMKKWGRKYPDAGYGVKFSMWLQLDDRRPYNSYGNGSAMRVSAVGWLYNDIETVRKMARLSAEVSHNHPG